MPGDGARLQDRGELPERPGSCSPRHRSWPSRSSTVRSLVLLPPCQNPQGRHPDARLVLAAASARLEFQQLVPLRRRKPYETEGAAHQRRRDGFGLTDPRATPREARSEIDYCIYCHSREKDSCSKGFHEKDSERYKKNPLGIPLTGCPLEERISEMQLKAREGDMVARWRWCASTIRWRRAPGIASATTA